MSGSADAPKQASVLFVCLGNICRSTMAEGVFRDITSFDTGSPHPAIKNIDSCGTGAYHTGDGPDRRTMNVLKDNGITSYKHRARQVRVPSDFVEYDYILAMDQNNYEDLKDMAQRAIKKGTLDASALTRVHLYGEYGGQKHEEIDDPYYGGKDGFTNAYEQAKRFGQGLLKHIEESQAGESKI